jgi:hypothetical protein
LWISVSAPYADLLKKGAKPVPTPIRVRLLLDTGAKSTCLDPSIFKSLSLSPTGTTFIRTPSTGQVPFACNTYDVSITILHTSAHLFRGSLPVMEADFRAQGIDGLLGRDVLSDCLVIYDGPGQSFTLSF